jgi:dTDP-4-dehydrorhamnose 3,5-epimerase
MLGEHHSGLWACRGSGGRLGLHVSVPDSDLNGVRANTRRSQAIGCCQVTTRHLRFPERFGNAAAASAGEVIMAQQSNASTAPRGRIDGVGVKDLKVIPDQRGRLMEILRCDDELFEAFGQVYMTTAYPGVVKAWHYHTNQTDNWAVVQGMALVGLYDPREGSPTRGHVNAFYMGVHNPILLQIPAGVMHGFKCVSETEAIVINIPTQPYNRESPDELRAPARDPSIPFNWDRQDG